MTTFLASEAEVAPRVTIPHNARLQPSSETGSTATVLASIFRPSPEFAPPRSPFLVVEEQEGRAASFEPALAQSPKWPFSFSPSSAGLPKFVGTAPPPDSTLNINPHHLQLIIII